MSAPFEDPVGRRLRLDREHRAAGLAERNADLTISPDLDMDEPVDQEFLDAYAEALWRVQHAPPPPPDFYSPSAKRQRQQHNAARVTRSARKATIRRAAEMSPSASADSGGSDPDDAEPASAGINHLAASLTPELMRVWDEIAGWGGADEWHFARLLADLETAQPHRAKHEIIEMAERIAEQANLDFILDQIIGEGVQW